MKSTKTIIRSFFAALMLLFAHAWSPSMLAYVWVAVIVILLFGGFAWMLLHVVTETLGQFKATRAKVIALVVLLALFALTASLSAFYVWTVIAALVLFSCLFWRGIQDYGSLFRRHKPQTGPEDWTVLNGEALPRSSAASRAHAKYRLAHSYGVHITCTPRAGAMGFISHPLRMDE